MVERAKDAMAWAYLDAKRDCILAVWPVSRDGFAAHFTLRSGGQPEKAPGFPVRRRRAQAQADLEAVAKRNGWARCCELCGCTDAAPCDGGCAWAQDGLCTTCAEGMGIPVEGYTPKSEAPKI